MKKMLIFLLFIFGCSTSKISDLKPHSKNASFTLGSLHGHMLNGPYGLREFIAALYFFNPDIILTEVRPESPGPLEGSIDGGIEQSIVYSYAGINRSKVIPVDWFDDNYLLESAQEDMNKISSLKLQALPIASEYQKIIGHGSIFEVHGETAQKDSRRLHDLDEKYGRLSWRTRNEKICKNIQHSLNDLHNKKVLVIFGLDHKYYIDDCLKRLGTEVLSINAWLNRPN